MRRAVLMPVGPGEVEVSRMHSTLHSVREVEPGEIDLILVDDNPTPRELTSDLRWSGNVELIRTPLWEGTPPEPYVAMTAGTLLGLAAARDCGAGVVVKLDTDAFAIAPFFQQIEMAMERRPYVGMFGSCRFDCHGQTRAGLATWGKILKKKTVKGLMSQEGRYVSRLLISAARQPGYTMGDHCLGGAYAVADSALQSALWDRWESWSSLNVSEDVVVGALVGAAGLEWEDLTGVGEVFALSWQGMPGEPTWIKERGYSLVHSVKCPTWSEETALRQSLLGPSVNA